MDIELGIGLAVCFAAAWLMLRESDSGEEHPSAGRAPAHAPTFADAPPTLNGSSPPTVVEPAVVEPAVATQPPAPAEAVPAPVEAMPAPVAVLERLPHPDYEIVELPTGPTPVRIGQPQRRPDPDRLIQTIVIEPDGPTERMLALLRLVAVIAAVGLVFGFGVVYGPRLIAWLVAG